MNIEQLLHDLEFEEVKELRSAVRRVKPRADIRTNPQTFILKPGARKLEVTLLTDVFPSIDDSNFETLQLPEAIKSGKWEDGGYWILMRDYGDPL
jgi:hypothetical protein